jgi:DNA-binding transcriptional LysR family regulator
MDLDRRHLEHLLEVIAQGSVTRAAESLGLSQPALSRSIRELERLLGLRLFDRLHHGTVPTAAGEALAARARRVLADLGELEREAHKLGHSFRGEVAVGLGPGVAGGTAVLEVGRLLAIHPELHCRVAIAPTLELARQLRRLELDFFVADQGSLDGQSDGFEVEGLVQDVRLFCRAGHPLLRCVEPLSEISSYPIAALGPTPAGVVELRAMLREAGAPIGADWAPRLWVSHAAPLAALLLESDTIGATVPYAHLRELEAGLLREVPAPRAAYRGRVGPVRLRSRPLSPAAEALWAAITSALRTDLALSQAYAARSAVPSGPPLPRPAGVRRGTGRVPAKPTEERAGD